MAQLGDKQYNYNYYGLPDTARVWGTQGVGGYAALIYLNMWGLYMGPPISEFFTDGIYWEHDGNTSDTYGEPLDDSVALWRISRNCSFACNAVFSAETGSILKPHYEVNVHSSDAPLAMCAVDTHGGAYGNFSTDPRNRWAYDVSNENNGSYSAMIYDIVYNTMCLQVNTITVNLASPGAQPATRDLASLAAYIDGDADNRFVQIIRPSIYRGASTPRYKTADGIPPQGSRTTYNGIPLIDTLTDRPIPSTETHLKDYIKDGHSERRDDVVYNPFVQKLEEAIFTTPADATDATAQLDIGFNRWLSMNNLRNGIRVIPNTTYRITAQYYRCNYDIKNFSDVVYQWENIVMNNSNGMILPDDFDLTLLPSNTTFRVMTRLRIIDAKGNSIGKATELAVKHEIACIGMYFCDTVARAENTELGTAATGVYLPLFSGGVPTGEYVTGDEIPLQPHATAGSIADSTFNYDPDETPGGEDTGDFRTRINSGAISAGTIYYAVSDTEFKDLVRYLNTTYNPDEADLAADFKGVNPFEYITSVKYYPFPLPYAVAQQINVGPLATGVTGYIMPYTYGNAAYSYFDFGSYTFTPRFKNFLDYSATQIQLFLPWCGVVNLDPTIWIAPPGYNPITLKIRYSFDYVTGSVTAFIFRDNGNGEFLIDSADGTAGVDVPLSLFATGTYQQQISQAGTAYKLAATSRFGAFLGIVGGLTAAGLSAAMGNPLGAIGGIGATITSVGKLTQTGIQADAAAYTLEHTQPNLGSVSAASPFNAAVMDQRPFILITRPRMQSTLPKNWETTYAHTVGYACTVPIKLSDSRVRGFTIIQSPRLEGIKKTIGSATFTPTEQELALIRQHMAAGIIL